jgi:hypothetical protein
MKIEKLEARVLAQGIFISWLVSFLKRTGALNGDEFNRLLLTEEEIAKLPISDLAKASLLEICEGLGHVGFQGGPTLTVIEGGKEPSDPRET